MGDAEGVDFGIWQVMPILVLPIAFATAIFLIHYGWKKGRLIQILPLLAVQLNSMFVWSCTLCFWYAVALTEYGYVKPKDASFGQFFLFSLFDFALMLEPLNNFLYSWTFLDTLEHEYQGGKKRICRIFKLGSIVLVPLVYFGLFFVLVFTLAKATDEYYLQNYGLSNKFDDIAYSLFKVLGYWTTITNILCCVILGFVIRFVRKITKQPLDFAVTLQSEEL